MRIAACILAAGAGRRMGQEKADVQLAGRSFAALLLNTFESAQMGPLYVVARAETAVLETACAEHGAQLLLNPDPERGMLSSLHVCLQALMQRPDAASIAGLFVNPVDCPRVHRDTIAQLGREFETRGAPLVLPVHNGRRGHPVLFGATVFAELLQAPLEVGARAVVWAHAAERLEVEVNDAGVLDDLDTPAAVEAARDRAADQRKR
jgi:CTP:molybdopterin cytidylyltransferase MocA